jgi:hypothetical protein
VFTDLFSPPVYRRTRNSIQHELFKLKGYGTNPINYSVAENIGNSEASFGNPTI